MTKTECKEMIDGYLRWLKEGLHVEELESSCVISTPFLDRHNDEIEVYVEKKGDNLLLTDDGYTLADLRDSGVMLDSPKREHHLQSTLRGFGIKLVGEELCVNTTVKDFPQRKHNLIQAMIAINDMYVMGEESILQLFKEDVEKLLRSNNIQVFRDLKLSGRSGFDHKFDFGLSATNQTPEGVLQAVNRLSKDQATSIAFMVADVKLARGEDSLTAYAFINDIDNELSSDHLDALFAYNIKAYRWTERETAISRLKNERGLIS